jgi:hypothetical protein
MIFQRSQIYIFIIITLKVLSTASNVTAQTSVNGAWCLPSEIEEVNGVSFSFLGCLREERCISNGIRLEFPGLGFIIPLAPSPMVEDEKGYSLIMSKPIDKKIRGLNISMTGTWTHGDITGLSLGGLCQVSRQSDGLFLSLINNKAVDLRGMQVALYGNSAGHANGIQLALTGNTALSLQGLQIGVWNKANNSGGIQIGFVNVREISSGFQIGIININKERLLPFFNW